MTISILPPPKMTFLDSAGVPLSGGKVYSYEPGSSTPKDTYTDSTGDTANANPVILDSRGEADIWLSGLTKIVLKDSNDVEIYTVDNVSSQPATGTATLTDWLTTGVTPTYVSATQFTVPTDVTGTFQVGRRVKCVVSAGTIYGTITASEYTTLTTVTVVIDTGALDNGLTTADVGLLASINDALPKIKYLVTDGTATDNAASIGQLQGGAFSYIADTGTADVYVADLVPAITAYTTGMEIRVKITNAAITTTPTLNVNSLGAKTIKKGNSVDLVVGDLPANHQAVFRYDGTDFILQNPIFPATFGGWTLQTVGTVYQAPTDGFVKLIIISDNDGDSGLLDFYTDANTPPTFRAAFISAHYSSTDHVRHNSDLVPIKAGDYYKSVSTNIGTAPLYYMYWIPRHS